MLLQLVVLSKVTFDLQEGIFRPGRWGHYSHFPVWVHAQVRAGPANRKLATAFPIFCLSRIH